MAMAGRRAGGAGATNGLAVGSNETVARTSRPGRARVYRRPQAAMRSRVARDRRRLIPAALARTGQMAWWQYTIVLRGSTSTRIVGTITQWRPPIFRRAPVPGRRAAGQ